MLFAFFHWVNIYTNGAKVLVGKTSGSLAQIKAMVPNCIDNHCILISHLLKGMPVALKNIINEAVKIKVAHVGLTKHRPWGLCYRHTAKEHPPGQTASQDCRDFICSLVKLKNSHR